MMRVHGVLALCLLALGPSLSKAADLSQLYQQAITADPQLAAAEAGLRAAEAEAEQARAGLLPSIVLSASQTDSSTTGVSSGTPAQDSETGATALSLTQPLYRQDRWIQKHQGQLGHEIAQLQLEAAHQALALRLAQAYFGVLGAADNLTLAQAEQKAVSRQLEQARQRFKVGLIAITDVNEAQARYDLSLAQEIAAEAELDRAREELAEIIDQTPQQLHPLREGMVLTNPQPASRQVWIDRAFNNNLGIQIQQLQLEQAREEIARQRAGHYPTLDLVATQTDSQVESAGVTVSDVQDTSVSLQLTLPLYVGGATAAGTRVAQGRMEQALSALESERRAVRRQASQGYLAVLSDISRVKALRQALKSSQTALQATEAGFKVGTRTIVDVLNAQQALYRAQRDLSQAQYGYLLNWLNLKQAAGNLSEHDIDQINDLLRAP